MHFLFARKALRNLRGNSVDKSYQAGENSKQGQCSCELH